VLAPHLAGGWCARSARKARVRSGSWQGQTFGTDRTSAHPSNAAVRVAALHGPHRGWNVIMKQLAQIALFQRRRGSTTPRHLSAWSDPPAGPSRVPGARRHQQGRDAHGRLGSQPCSRSSAVEWHTKNVFRGKFHWHCGAPRIGLAGRLAAEYPAASARCLGLAYPDARGLGGGWGACRTSVGGWRAGRFGGASPS
jgi:hypothetical protein